MKLRSDESYWLLKNGIMFPYPSLSEDTACEILVIGGGITGALMAFQLAREGNKIILLDKRDIGLGSTGASSSLLQYELDEPLHTLIEKVGEGVAVSAYKGGVQAIEGLTRLIQSTKIECGFKTKNSLYIAHTGEDCESLEKEFKCRKRYGFAVRWLSSADLRSAYGVNGYGAILSDTGASLDVYQLCHALLQLAARKYGLRIYDHTAVEKVGHHQGYNTVSTDQEVTITCRDIVYATGYETASFMKEKIVKLVSTYACVTEPIENLPHTITETIFWNTEDPYLYVRSTADNRILIGGEDEPFSNPERRDRLIDEKEAVLIEKFRALMPSAPPVFPDFAWAGTFGITKDTLPYMGPHPDFPNSFFVLGFGGNGITFSVMAMDVISDAVAGRPNKFLEHFKFKRDEQWKTMLKN